MKTLLCASFFLFATAAFGQSVSGGAGLSAEPTVTTFPSHTLHASRQAMAENQDLLEGSTFTSAHGEKPLWEIVKPKQERPLGDIAREFRKQRDAGSKAVMRLED